MSSVFGGGNSSRERDEEWRKVLRDYHVDVLQRETEALERLEALGMGWAAATNSLKRGGTTVAVVPAVGGASVPEAVGVSSGAGDVVEGSVDAGDDESAWGVIIYAIALVKGCKNIEDALDVLFDTYRSPLTLDDVAKTLLKAGVSKAGSGELAERIKSLKSTIYSLAAQKRHLRCSGGMIERVDVAEYGVAVGSTADGGVVRQTA